jgi:hypothetical protein
MQLEAGAASPVREAARLFDGQRCRPRFLPRITNSSTRVPRNCGAHLVVVARYGSSPLHGQITTALQSRTKRYHQSLKVIHLTFIRPF